MSNPTLKKLKYAFKEGYRINSVSADDVGNELQRIYKEREVLSPENIVNESRPVEAVLHPAFEWDNFKAAEFYRREQARKIIKSVTVIEHKDETPKTVFVHVPLQSNAGYHPVEVVAKRMDYYTLALHELIKNVNAVENSIKHIQSLAEKENLDSDRISKINIAIQAMATAQSAVMALN